MKYLVINKQVGQSSFPFTNLNITDYRNIRFGKEDLISILRKKLPSLFADAEISMTDQGLDNIDSLPKRNDENDCVIYFDMAIFPLDFAKLDNVLHKAFLNGKSTRFFVKDGDKKSFLPIALFADSKQETLEIDLSGMVADLSDAESLLQIFSSNFNSRYFNSLKQTSKNYIEKSSEKITKIRSEYNFLANIPNDIKTFYPQVGSYRQKDGSAEYEIEKIYMLDLSKQIINKILQENDIEKLLKKITAYITLLDRKEITSNDFRKNFDECFLDKNQERFAAIKNLQVFTKLNEVARIQGYESCEDFFNQLQNALKNAIDKKLKDNFLFFSHGDLCFSNILYDIHTSNIKFIDPKGFNEEISETYRTIYYDLAKLSHSFLGLYDFILYDMVEVKFSAEAKLVLDFEIEQKYRELLRDKFTLFIQNLGFDLQLVRLFEASLFLSMIPLHQEDQKRMVAQFLQAVSIFESINS